MTLGESIEKAILEANLPKGTLINSPRVLRDNYYGKGGTYTHGYSYDEKFMKEQECLNARLVATRDKEPDLI